MTSLSSVSAVQRDAQQSALRSFKYFANTVLGTSLAEDVCCAAQDVVEDQEDALIHTGRPRAVSIALSAWLRSRGINVLCNTPLLQSEILSWLQLDECEESGLAVSLEALPQGVVLKWL